jgi:hypothetical protein
MLLLVLKAYTQLIRFDISLARGNFAVLYDTVRSSRVGKNVGRPHSIDQICKAIDMACIWYRKQVLCLQRSAATACLLKQYGFKAEMVMGAQHMPFKAHAWVEVNGRPVNDATHAPERYIVLDRC